MHYGAPPGVFRQAQLLRNNPTAAEAKLWSYLRKNQLKHKFRRQHPTWIYVVDFYCHKLRFVIEIDGGIHEESEVQENDIERTQNLIALGLQILRFSNEQVLFDIDFVLSEIAHKIEELKQLSYSRKIIK
jgi:very-short-patch-repair endonuclease